MSALHGAPKASEASGSLGGEARPELVLRGRLPARAASCTRYAPGFVAAAARAPPAGRHRGAGSTAQRARGRPLGCPRRWRIQYMASWYR